jgi:hypothetical protein
MRKMHACCRYFFSCVPTFHDSTLLHLLQDYEYASFNPVAYDIANHFCEMAADYHSEKPHILDYNKYPGTAWTDAFLLFFKYVCIIFGSVFSLPHVLFSFT